MMVLSSVSGTSCIMSSCMASCPGNSILDTTMKIMTLAQCTAVSQAMPDITLKKKLNYFFGQKFSIVILIFAFLKIQVFCGSMECHLKNILGELAVSICMIVQEEWTALKMEATEFSKMSVTVYQLTWLCTTEVLSLYQHCCESLISWLM